MSGLPRDKVGPSLGRMPPTVTFRPSGAEKFIALMMHMVGCRVEVVWLRQVNAWRGDNEYEIAVSSGEIVSVDDGAIFLRKYGVPKEYTANNKLKYISIPWSLIRMIEVI